MLSFCPVSLLLLLCNLSRAIAFYHPINPARSGPPIWTTRITPACTSLASNSDAAAAASASNNPVDELSDERKANLFQFLLRDLQVEGVPLLAVDANQVDTLQAAMWTTLAELCDQAEADQACLVLEDLPVDTLRTFVDDFMALKTEERLVSVLPELQRVNVTLVGKGVGPAILISVDDVSQDLLTSDVDMNEPQASAALKAFWGRMVEKTDTRPYKQPGTPTSYKLCRRSDAPHILSSFWNCLCELRATDEDALGTSVLMLPGIESHERFTALSELLSRSLCLYKGEESFDLVHFFPEYNRDKVYPIDKAALGHIPPMSWLRSMLQSGGTGELDDNQFSDEDLALSNYQRRSPLPAIAMKRVSIIDTDAVAAVPFTLDNGESVEASGVPLYVQNTRFLAAEGKLALDEALAQEKSFLE